MRCMGDEHTGPTLLCMLRKRLLAAAVAKARLFVFDMVTQLERPSRPVRTGQPTSRSSSRTIEATSLASA